MYVLVAIMCNRLGLEASLFQAIDHDASFAQNANQLILFDF